MEKDIGKVKKNDNTDIVVRIDDFGGKRGVTIREFIKGERYTGFTKAGTRIPAEKFQEFRQLINKIDLKDLEAEKEKVEEVIEKEIEKAEEVEEKVKETAEVEVKKEKKKRGRKKKAVEEKPVEGIAGLMSEEEKVEVEAGS